MELSGVDFKSLIADSGMVDKGWSMVDRYAKKSGLDFLMPKAKTVVKQVAATASTSTPPAAGGFKLDKKMLIWGGAAIGGLLLIMMMGKKR